ncbi:ABC transporter ATP-binding protein [candidate division KSB1 bacterium]
MISVKNVSKKFGSKQVLFNISFDVKKGEILGFLGPNAAGKTTTMRIITCFLPSNEGTVTVKGYDVVKNSLEVRQNIGYMPENPPIYPEMTVKDYLNFVAEIKNIKSGDIPKRVDEVMEKVNLTHVKERICGRLSKGYRQRVGLAQALIHNPPILILDEPTSGLDPSQIIEVRQLIKNLAGDHTIILSTHIMQEVKLTCERILIVNDGRIVAQGTEDELKTQIMGKEKITLEVGGPKEDIISTFKNIPGVVNIELDKSYSENVHTFNIESKRGKDIRKDLSKEILNRNWDLYGLWVKGMTLEEIFMNYISGTAYTEGEA